MAAAPSSMAPHLEAEREQCRQRAPAASATEPRLRERDGSGHRDVRDPPARWLAVATPRPNEASATAVMRGPRPGGGPLQCLVWLTSVRAARAIRLPEWRCPMPERRFPARSPASSLRASRLGGSSTPPWSCFWPPPLVFWYSRAWRAASAPAAGRQPSQLLRSLGPYTPMA